MSIGVNNSERIVSCVPIHIKALRISEFGVGDWGGDGGPVGGEEAAHRGGIVAGAEVVEIGFGVAFFAGEFVGGEIGGGADGVVLLAEGIQGVAIDDGSCDAGENGGGSEIVVMDEIGGGVLVLGDKLAAGVDVAPDPHGAIIFGDDVAGKIEEIAGLSRSDDLLYAPSLSVVEVARCRSRTGAGRAVGLDELIFHARGIVKQFESKAKSERPVATAGPLQPPAAARLALRADRLCRG